MSWESDFTYSEASAPIEHKEGIQRVIITDVKETISKAGNPMLVVSITPDNDYIDIRDYFVKNSYFNNNISRFFDAFPDIKVGTFNFTEWVGKIGVVELKRNYNGYLDIERYINPNSEEAANLPEWNGIVKFENNKDSNSEFSTAMSNMIAVDNDVPF